MPPPVENLGVDARPLKPLTHGRESPANAQPADGLHEDDERARAIFFCICHILSRNKSTKIQAPNHKQIQNDKSKCQNAFIEGLPFVVYRFGVCRLFGI
jgi:hypothetical protein